MRIARKIIFATIAAGIVAGSLSLSTGIAAADAPPHPVCTGRIICVQ